jgi:diaminopimelate epimerase
MKKASPRQAKGLPFYKLQGAGNDLIVFFRKDFKLRNKAEGLRRMAHRQLGLGTDQFAEVVSRRPLAIQIWNSDGSTAEMCANGSRSFLFLAAKMGWISKTAKQVELRISGREYSANRLKHGYELGLGVPVVGALEQLAVGGFRIPFTPVTTGNPHAVILHGNVAGAWMEPAGFSYKILGPEIETHRRFPAKTNVEFVRSWKLESGECIARVEAWERGAGATLSCGSGAVAVAAVLRKKTGASFFRIQMTDFELQVRFEGDQAFLSGPCALVASGTYFF